MRPFLTLAAALVATLTLAACKNEEGVFTSPEGHSFAFLQRPDAQIVAVQLAFPMDWTLQQGSNPHVPQIAAETMTTGGAEGYSPDEVLETMQDLNAEAFLYPQFNALRGGLNVAPEHLDAAVTLANAVLRAPRFDDTWMTRSKDRLIADATAMNAQSANQGFYALRLAMMGDSAFSEAQSYQDTAAIAAVTADMARAWHQQTVVAGRVVVAVAGPISAKEAGEMVDKLLAGLPRATGGFIEPKAPPYNPRQIVLHVPQAEKTTLTLLTPITPTGTPDDVSDVVGTMLLSGDDQALLFQEIRTKLRASYGMVAVLENYARKSRFLAITGEVDSDKTAQVVDVVKQVISKMTNDLLDPALVDRHKSAIYGGLADWDNNTTGLATSMVEAVLDGTDPMGAAKLADMVDRVSPLSIKERWMSHFALPNGMMILAVSPDANALPGACVITEARQVLNCP